MDFDNPKSTVIPPSPMVLFKMKIYVIYMTISCCYDSKKILWIESVLGLTAGGPGS